MKRFVFNIPPWDFSNKLISPYASVNIIKHFVDFGDISRIIGKFIPNTDAYFVLAIDNHKENMIGGKQIDRWNYYVLLQTIIKININLLYN